MVIVINEYTGMSAEKPRKEIMCSAPSELADVEAGHGSIAYVIGFGTIYVYDEDDGVWVDTDGNPFENEGSV